MIRRYRAIHPHIKEHPRNIRFDPRRDLDELIMEGGGNELMMVRMSTTIILLATAN